jgi:hypothetical protein
MGAIRPWHLVVLSFCCLGSTAIIAGVVLLLVRRRK